MHISYQSINKIANIYNYREVNAWHADLAVTDPVWDHEKEDDADSPQILYVVYLSAVKVPSKVFFSVIYEAGWSLSRRAVETTTLISVFCCGQYLFYSSKE